MDPVKVLPTEVFEKILSYLNLKELIACCLVSQKWNIAANNDFLWKEVCLRNGWHDCGSLKEHINCCTFLTLGEQNSLHNLGEWKKNYVLKNQLQNNWRFGNAKDLELPLWTDDDWYIIGNITTVSSDGHILAYGTTNGLIKLYDLKRKGKHTTLKTCALSTAVDHILIVNEYIFVIQNYLLQIYKINDCDNLELYCIKIIKGSSITNVDIPTLMLIDRPDRKTVLDESHEEDNVIFYFNESYIIFTSLHSHEINVYDLKSDFTEPNITFILNTDINNSYIFNIHAVEDLLYVVIGEYEHNRMSIQAYSLRNKTLLFEEIISDRGFLNATCTIESNELYLVIRSQFTTFFLIERNTGKVLLKENGLIFLNAHSNSKLVGISLDDCFQIIDPNTGNAYFCVTLEGLPLAVYSDVIVTMCAEFNRDCAASTEIEFWNMYNTTQRIDSIKFPKIYEVILLYKDKTKLIFYAPRNHFVVRNFLVF